MAIDPVDRQLVTGGTTTGNLPGFTFQQDDRNVLMVFILRHSSAGEQQWARVRGGGGGGQKVQHLQIDPSDRHVAGMAELQVPGVGSDCAPVHPTLARCHGVHTTSIAQPFLH